MRILQLSDFYPPVAGGQELVVRAIAEGLVRRGHDVSVCTSVTPGAPSVLANEGGVDVHRLRGWSRLLTPFYDDPGKPFQPTIPDPGIVRQMRRIVSAFAPDVIHAHSWIVHSVLGPYARRGRPLVLSMHDFGIFCAKKTNLRENAVCSQPSWSHCLPCSRDHYGLPVGTALATGTLSGLRRLDGIARFLPVSDAVRREALRATGLDSDRFTVIPSFLPDDVVPQPADTDPDVLPDEPFILFVGVLGRYKGLDVLLEAHAGLADPPILLMLGLPGDLDPPLTDRVRLIRNASRELVALAWNRALVGVVPSVWPDAAPLSVLEGLRSGTPLIGSNIGGIPDQIGTDGAAGIIVPPGSSSAIARALNELLEDGGRRAAMSAAAVRRYGRFKADNVLAELETVYGEVQPH
jgi:glycosyltransferase involved in cell wall biosynthesis